MILYISKLFEQNIGATMHYLALKELFGEKNIFTIDLRPGEPRKSHNFYSYGKYRNNVDRIIRWFQGNMMFISNDIISEICGIVKQRKVELVFIEDSVFGNLVCRLKKECPEVQVASFYHDIKADLYPQWIKEQKRWIDTIEYSIGISQEKKNQQYSDINIVFNQRDAEKFKTYYGRLPEAKIALPAPVPKISDEIKGKISIASEKKKLLFVGKKYYPNLVGFRWFVDNVLPSLSDNIQVDVVGRGLEELREEYSDPRINVIGGVDSLDSYYIDADIVIAPLFDGGGMKSKTVEALSYGKVFVGTEESLFGFWEEMDENLRNRTVFQHDSADEWIDTINRLVANEVHKFDEETYSLFVKKFSYESARDKLADLLFEGEK